MHSVHDLPPERKALATGMIIPPCLLVDLQSHLYWFQSNVSGKKLNLINLMASGPSHVAVLFGLQSRNTKSKFKCLNAA